ncbi:MAG: cyclic nucleotide-binding domain-containing protein [Spirochaetota bacterium]|nr:cyclic nucleotide-binding domain-containing protein [Spirochaetota bacterium]
MNKEIDFLKSVKLLQGLNNNELFEFSKICKRIEVPKDKILMKEGEPGDTMYLFMEGVVEVTNNLTMKIGKKGFEEAEKSMVRLDAKNVNFFGDMSILSDSPRSATVKTLTECVLYEVTKNDFDDFCIMYPAMGYKILKQISDVLCARVRKGNKDILKLTTALSIALSK